MDRLISVPPNEEQELIVNSVDMYFSLIAIVEARYAKAKIQVNKLTQSILAKAFRGELIPQGTA